MHFTLTALATVGLASLAAAKLHHVAYCTGPDYNWGNDLLADATSCACNYYLHRNTGGNWWDTCPDCNFDGTFCNSKAQHIGGDEFHYYCTRLCGASGSLADE